MVVGEEKIFNGSRFATYESRMDHMAVRYFRACQGDLLVPSNGGLKSSVGPFFGSSFHSATPCSCKYSSKAATLGAEGVLPGRHIVSFLRVFKQFTHTLPSG